MRTQRGTVVLPGTIAGVTQVRPFAWSALPLHPVVMAVDTYDHRRVRGMAALGDTLLIGYGDWMDNLGPVSVVGYDLKPATPVPVTLFGPCPTEAFDRVRVIDGVAYLPWTDPTGTGPGGFTTNRGGTWANVTVGPMVHTFDVASFGGRLYVCGSASKVGDPSVGQGVVWREETPGVWREVLRGTLSAPLMRFYAFARFGDELAVQARDGGAVLEETWSTTDGETWANVPTDQDYRLGPEDVLPELPAYLPAPGVNVFSTVTHKGWCYISSSAGVVRRVRLL